MRLDEIKWSRRTRIIVQKNFREKTVEDLKECGQQIVDVLLSYPRVGPKVFNEIARGLKPYGIRLQRMKEPGATHSVKKCADLLAAAKDVRRFLIRDPNSEAQNALSKLVEAIKKAEGK